MKASLILSNFSGFFDVSRIRSRRQCTFQVVSFFPQGIDENNLGWLFPTISDVTHPRKVLRLFPSDLFVRGF